ncbi:MAG: amidase family protein [Ferrimicrobium sp.]
MLAASMEPKEESNLVVTALEDAGFLPFGRTNAPTFGVMPVAENLRYGVTGTPRNLEQTPRGSSGASPDGTPGPWQR